MKYVCIDTHKYEKYEISVYDVGATKAVRNLSIIY